jgi:multidrug transporter EmrE-like cation transporter
MNFAWLTLGAAILVSLSGQILLKAGALGSVSASAGFIDQLFRWQTIIGLGCYGGAALLYIIALRRLPMSIALPCTAASYVVIALVGWAAFGESLGVMKLLAIALICGGVVLLASTA